MLAPGIPVQLPASFGKYELLERIATGGMAEVFLARSFGVAGFEKHLVIKRIRQEHAQDPRFISLFVNEAKIGVHLNHPNVVHIYDLGRVGSSWYIAMEHLHGRDLTRLVKTLRAEGERLPLPVAVAIVAEICRGLAYAHGLTDSEGSRLGLVHQDVSPHNVLVTFAGEVKLVDFGIARLVNTQQAKAEGRTPGRPGGGKYAYMSPEQALGQAVDHRTDIFSAGIVLWELIVGHRLFDHKDPSEKLRMVQQAVIPDPRDEGIALDQELWQILERALARDRDARYADAALFEEDLRAWLFRAGHRVGRKEVAAEMARAFPGTATRTPGDIDLARLVADVERLDARETSHSGPTPSGGLLKNARLMSGEGERKTVAVLLVDVDGMTALSERIEPELLFKRHYQLLRWLRRIVDRFGGCVQRAVDDQIVVLFGVPRTRADDLDRAIECALELQRSVEELHDHGLAVALAIGLHCGEVTLSPGRRPVRYVARGDTTRLARRLSALADHGQVLVSERVLQRAQGAYRFVGGPDVRNRGGQASRPSFLLVGRRTGLRLPRQGAWVRRGPELDVIRDALVGLGEGHGRAIAFLGDHGVGKSRLVQEIHELATRRGLPIYVSRCTPFGEDAPFEPFRALVREVLGVEPEEPRSAVGDRLERLAHLGLSRPDVEAMAALLGLPDQEASADAQWHALGSLVRGLAEAGPVVIALDDVHHLGAREIDELRRLLLVVPRLPVLFLFTTRKALPRLLEGVAIEVTLGGLEAEDQRRLLRRLLQVREVDGSLVDLVQRTCEGNPLYIAEMVQFLVQQGHLDVQEDEALLTGASDAPPVPETLAALLSARIDALDAASKGALQLAAVIGMTFPASLLCRAAGVDDPTPLVTELASHGLIHPVGEGGETWTLASELVREAALRGILGVQRRDYHRMVAAAIEELPPERLDDRLEMLAWHCAHGGRPLDAGRYAWQVGQALEKAQLLERAREWYGRGLTWIEAAEQTPDTWDVRVQGEAMLNLRYGAVSLLLSDSVTGTRALQIALDISSDAGLPWVEIRAHLELARSYLVQGRGQLSRAHIEQARALLRLERDPELELEALEAAAHVAYETGRNDEARALWQEALERSEDKPEAMARCLLGLANRHIRAGEIALAEPKLERALGAARSARDRILEGRVLNNLGLLQASHGRHQEALELFRQALQAREGIGYARGVVVNHHNIGDAHLHMGDWARAHVAFARSRELAARIGWERGVLLNEAYLGYIDALQGRDEEGLTRLREAREAARRLGDGELVTTAGWLLGRRLMERGESEQGRAQLQEALAEATRFGLDAMAQAIGEQLGG